MKYAIIILVATLLLVVIINSCTKTRTLEAHMDEFGPLTPFTPKAAFIHMKDTSGHGYLFIKKGNQYQYIERWNIK